MGAGDRKISLSSAYKLDSAGATRQHHVLKMNYLQLVLDATKPQFVPSGKHLSDSDPSMWKVSVCYPEFRDEGGKSCFSFCVICSGYKEHFWEGGRRRIDFI